MKIKARRTIFSQRSASNVLTETLTILLMTMMLSSCDKPQQAISPVPPLVRTLMVPETVPAKQVRWSGILLPGQEVTLGFRSEGRLAERRADTGMRVSRGTVLARLDATQSSEQIIAAQAALSEAEAQLHKAQQDAARIRKLIEIGTAPRARLQEYLSILAAAQAQRARAAAQQAEASNTSEFNLIRAPFDGVVTDVSATPGQTLSQGQQIMQFASDKNKQIVLNLPYAFSKSLHLDDKLRVEFDNGVTTTATVMTISPQSNPQTLLIQVKAALDGKAMSVPFGSVLTGTVIQDNDRVRVIPAAALTRKGNSPAVYVVSSKANILELRPISVRYYGGDTAAVSSGLSAGEKIVTAGVSRLMPGMKITLQDGAW